MSTCNTEQAAKMFLTVSEGYSSQEKVAKLAGMMDLYCAAAYNRGIAAAQAVYRESGGDCRNRPGTCDCLLCRMDKKRIKT